MKTGLSNIKIIELGKDDLSGFKDLIGIFIKEFGTKQTDLPSDGYLTELLGNSYFKVFVAKMKNEVVGGMTTYELIKYYSEKAEIYIYDIAVKEELHNLGIGKKMISYLKKYGNQKATDSIYVQAESDNEQAIKFYESTIGKGEKVKHFTIDYTG